MWQFGLISWQFNLFVSPSLETMPVCDICCEELPSEAAIRTHLLLSHMENMMVCPFCSLSGVSYDELSFHINTAHTEKDYQDTNVTLVNSGQKNDCIAKSTSNVNTTNARKVSQASPQLLPQVKRIATQITGTSLSQGPSIIHKISAPAVATANAKKLVRTTQTPSNDTRRKSEDGHHKSKQKRLSSPIKGALDFTASNWFYILQLIKLTTQSRVFVHLRAKLMNNSQ